VPPGGNAVRGERVERDPLVRPAEGAGQRRCAEAGWRPQVGQAEAGFILSQVSETPDITLAELQEKLKRRGLMVGIGTLWRFFDRRRITFKKRRRMPPSSSAAT